MYVKSLERRQGPLHETPNENSWTYMHDPYDCERYDGKNTISQDK